MGMLGALGKMNWTSSNLLLRRQFSARKILRIISICVRGQPARGIPASPTITKAVGNDDGGCVSLESGNDHRLRHIVSPAV